MYEIPKVTKPGDSLSKGFDIFIVALIGLNMITISLESVKSIQALLPRIFKQFICLWRVR